MDIEVVIGANYGDEGKGLFTEFLCRNRPNPIVVLSNGGSQRGHTINNAETNIRHVFSHFGSGTLLGVPSVYSKTFLLNPIRYIEEKRELNKVGIVPIAFRVPGCILQLPGDMFTNQELERARGKDRHGSCGWGIWETFVRNNEHRKLSFEDFAALDYEMKRNVILEEIEWQFYNRLDDYRDNIDLKTMECIMSESFIEHFIKDFEEMERDVKLLSTDNLLDVDWNAQCSRDVKTLVVENGQGLLLDINYAPIDENGKTDIHTTPSRCGMEGAIAAIGDGIYSENVTANYISRTYFTRHGAGPFPEEDYGISFKDKTNKSNEHQGTLRFGKIDETSAAQLLSRIKHDSSKWLPTVKCNLVMMHCNEIEPFRSLKQFAKFFSYEDDSRKIVVA